MAKLNPKHIRAEKDGKAPLEYLITAANAGEARVLQGGAKKYGRRNWTLDKILATTYIASMRRHIDEWTEGRDTDSDSGEHPLCHVRAACGIVIEATQCGMLIDDRLFAESISQEKVEGKLPEKCAAEPIFDREFSTFRTPSGEVIGVLPAHMYTYTVRYTDKDPHDRLFTSAVCYGPFATHELACNFIRSRDRDTSVIATIDKVTLV